jgi:hypothetical protein
MPVKHCRVTIQDLDGISHSVEVTAATLYEAVAQGLAAIRGHELGFRTGARHEYRARHSCERASAARGPSSRFHEVVGEAWGIAARSKPAMGDSEDFGDAGRPLEFLGLDFTRPGVSRQRSMHTLQNFVRLFLLQRSESGYENLRCKNKDVD